VHPVSPEPGKYHVGTARRTTGSNVDVTFKWSEDDPGYTGKFVLTIRRGTTVVSETTWPNSYRQATIRLSESTNYNWNIRHEGDSGCLWWYFRASGVGFVWSSFCFLVHDGFCLT